ncbi:tRNA (guanine(37)-N1)-methyltransferase [Striga asiatica]|uniref:tRNA (Guanine(37)-N1)-methyltransferase n=1 Tax=Striga asiatica TaxID=4170 RepID=A0A5A7PA80_STRAF|nr:tRNA (guanine(37)-N1)-methyltransferase [Striga asiatica]
MKRGVVRETDLGKAKERKKSKGEVLEREMGEHERVSYGGREVLMTVEPPPNFGENIVSIDESAFTRVFEISALRVPLKDPERVSARPEDPERPMPRERTEKRPMVWEQVTPDERCAGLGSGDGRGDLRQDDGEIEDKKKGTIFGDEGLQEKTR